MSHLEVDITLGVFSLTFLPTGGQEEEDERLLPLQCVFPMSGDDELRALTLRFRAA